MEIENETTSDQPKTVQEAHFKSVLDKVINPARVSRRPASYFPCCRAWNKRQRPTLGKETTEDDQELDKRHIGTQYTTWGIFGKGEEPLNYQEAWSKFKFWVSENQIPNDFDMPFVINQHECFMRDLVTVGKEQERKEEPVQPKKELHQTCPTLAELEEMKVQQRRMEVEMNSMRWLYKDCKARLSRVMKRNGKNQKTLTAQLEIRDGVIKDLLIALNVVTMKYEGRRVNEWKYKEKVYKGLIEFTNGRKGFDDSGDDLSSDTYGSIDSPRD